MGLSWRIPPRMSQLCHTESGSHPSVMNERGRAEEPKLAGVGQGAVYVAICTIRQREPNQQLCDVLSWRHFKAWNAYNSFKTYDTTYQHCQGQASALSYEPIRALQCNLFLNTTLFFKRTNTLTKNKAWPITPTVCGDHMSMEPTRAMEKPNPHIDTHTHVNHEN